MLRACFAAAALGAGALAPSAVSAATAVAVKAPLAPLAPLAAERQDAAAAPSATGTAELLAVRINGVDQDESALVLRLGGGGLAVPLETLALWRLAAPAAGRPDVDGREHARLDAVAGLRWRVEPREQLLVIEVGAGAFVRNGMEVVGAPAAAPLPAAVGGWINYDVAWQRESSRPHGAHGEAVASGFVDAGTSTVFGSGRTSAVARSGARAGGVTRLDTSWTIDRPDALTRIQLGDATGAGGQWGRSVRFAGARWSTDFSSRPGFVSFPLPAVRGEATVPSVVDLYVNEQHQLQGNVPPGAFDLPDVPVLTGQGQIRMVVRDLLGREQVVTQPYYVAPTLLRDGLHEFSVEGGAVRRDWGLRSFRYGRLQVTASDRAGVSDTLTRELRIELLRSQQTAGAGAVVLVGQAALLNGAVAASRSDAGAGWLVNGGAERQGAGWSASLQGRYATAKFEQLGLAYGRSAPTRLSVSGSVARNFGDVGVAANVLSQSDWRGQRFATTSLNGSRRVGTFGHLGVYASRTTGSTRGFVVGLSLTQTFGNNASATQTFFRSRDGAGRDPAGADGRARDTAGVQLQGSPEGDTGFGWRVVGEAGSAGRVGGEASWQGELATLGAEVARRGRSDGVRLGASGGVAFMPEGVFFARRIDGSYAVVDVGSYADVRVLRDNQVVARTDARGLAFVAGLRGYEGNRIGIEAADLPLDAEVDRLAVVVSPPARAGVSIAFPVRRTRSATLRVVDAHGDAIAAGSVLRFAAPGPQRDFPVGFDGRSFLAGLGDRDHVVATTPAGAACAFEVAWSGAVDDIADLGVAVCR